MILFCKMREKEGGDHIESLVLMVAVFTNALQSVFKKVLNKRSSRSEFTFSAMITTAALLFFVMFSGDISFSWQLIPYSLVYSACYATAAVTCVLALACGSMALTNLALAYSGVMPLLYSLITFREAMNVFQIVGLVCLGVSLVFTYYRRNKSGQKFTVKWIVYAMALFLSNGMCGIITRMQQHQFAGVYDRFYMIVSIGIAAVILWMCAAVREYNTICMAIRQGWWLSGICGAFNGITNFLTLISLLMIPGTVYYPVSSAGSLVVTCILSMTCFKEKLSRLQLVGFGLGVLAVIFLNITG